MSQSREVKRRIRSVDNTRQITRTMEMVATSKLKRATDRVYAARPYGDALEEIVRSLHDPGRADRFPILRVPESTRKAAILLLTANRGLAGAFNVNLIREARRTMEELRGQGVETELHVVGRKGIGFFRFQGEPMALEETELSDRPEPSDAEALIDPLKERFEAGELDAVYVVASRFKSALSTPPHSRKLLPIEASEERVDPENYILEPSQDDILNRLLPLYLRNAVYRALVENAAAEHGATGPP